MSDWKIIKGPIPIDELQAYIQDLSDERNKEDFPRLKFHEDTLIITDILCKFKGKRRMVTVDLQGRKKLFDIEDPFYSDGVFLYFDTELVELGWKEYYSYWKKLGTRPDVIEWCGEPYIVYSLTKITGDDSLYLTIGSKPTERIMIQLDKDSVIIRDHRKTGIRPRWILKHTKQLSYQTKYD